MSVLTYTLCGFSLRSSTSIRPVAATHAGSSIGRERGDNSALRSTTVRHKHHFGAAFQQLGDKGTFGWNRHHHAGACLLQPSDALQQHPVRSVELCRGMGDQYGVPLPCSDGHPKSPAEASRGRPAAYCGQRAPEGGAGCVNGVGKIDNLSADGGEAPFQVTAPWLFRASRPP